MSFGHCGIDWVHSLLDSHPEILILPEISFYRTWKIIGGDSKNTPNDLFLAFFNYLESHPYRQGNENKLFCDDNRNKVFYEQLKLNITEFGCDRKSVFFSFHSAFAFANSINLEKIKVIVEQEHVCFQSKMIFDDFDSPNMIFILRDPRASIAGYYRGIQRKCVDDLRCYQHLKEKSFAEWVHAVQIWMKNKDNIIILKNELLVKDIENEMRNLSLWMNITYDNSLTISTSSNGIEWKTDSCYISREDPEVDKNTYFAPVNVKNRWMTVLSMNDIVMIESLFHGVMQEFGYQRITTTSALNFIAGYLHFLRPYVYWRNNLVMSVFYYTKDILSNILVLFGDRSKKYE